MGRPEGEPLLTWHGLGTTASGAEMVELGPRLAAAGFRVLTPDAPGSGRSPSVPLPPRSGARPAVRHRLPILGGPGASLASGGQLSAHGDFMNGWDQKALARIVASCTARTGKADCGQRLKVRV
jgi:pimeloyl-ACP methyl ester carboxylesterase